MIKMISKRCSDENSSNNSTDKNSNLNIGWDMSKIHSFIWIDLTISRGGAQLGN